MGQSGAIAMTAGFARVDHVIEVGGPGTLAQSLDQAARIGGHIALIGVLTGLSGEVPTANLMRKQQRLRGLIVGSRQHQIEMIRGIEAIGVKPVIEQQIVPPGRNCRGISSATGRRAFRKDCA